MLPSPLAHSRSRRRTRRSLATTELRAPSVVIGVPVGPYFYVPRTFSSAVPVFAPITRVSPRPSIVPHGIPGAVEGFHRGFFRGFRGGGFSGDGFHGDGFHGGGFHGGGHH